MKKPAPKKVEIAALSPSVPRNKKAEEMHKRAVAESKKPAKGKK